MIVPTAIKNRSAIEYYEETSARLVELENLASLHTKFWTHRNPYGCWICDYILLTRQVLTTFGDFAGIYSDDSAASLSITTTGDIPPAAPSIEITEPLND